MLRRMQEEVTAVTATAGRGTAARLRLRTDPEVGPARAEDGTREEASARLAISGASFEEPAAAGARTVTRRDLSAVTDQARRAQW